MSAGPSISVIHLVRRQNGVEPLRAFMASYRSVEAGVKHELVLAMKGFQDDRQRNKIRAHVDVPHRVIDVVDRGYDVGSYWGLAERLNSDFACFLNSFSVILRPGWLAYLSQALSQEGVGLAGATGSYQSFWPTTLSSYLRVSRMIRHRPRAKELLLALPFAHHLNFLRRKLIHAAQFRPFPNYHVRTTGFIIRRDLMARIATVSIQSKMDAYRFESGKFGLTAQLNEMGFAPRIVGANGDTYMQSEWHLSNTFWQSNQENLLVADKQTRLYEEGPDDLRQVLAYLAWGDRARPVLRETADCRNSA
jgi:hypothetical protein